MIFNYSTKKTARIAGFLYLIVVLIGIFSLAYVPKTLFILDNATLTFNNIVSSDLLFRAGIFSSVICYVAFIFLPFVLYQLLKPVSELHPKIMTILALVSLRISFVNLQNKFSILSIIGKDEYLKVYSNE